jgi:hypothetical protein
VSRAAKAFSSEVDTGSREENASKEKARADSDQTALYPAAMK